MQKKTKLIIGGIVGAALLYVAYKNYAAMPKPYVTSTKVSADGNTETEYVRTPEGHIVGCSDLYFSERDILLENNFVNRIKLNLFGKGCEFCGKDDKWVFEKMSYYDWYNPNSRNVAD